MPVSPDLITAVTDDVLQEVAAWQQRPLEPVYGAVGFDALRVKIRDEGLVQHKAVYLALGILPSGRKEILGFWLAQTEGAAFWQRVMGELQGRGVRDIVIAMIDGLTGFPAAIEAVFPQTVIHQCVVHLVRQSLQHVNWKERKLEASPTGQKHPQIAPLWHRHWERLAPALAYPLPVRRLLYSSNAIESLHMTLRNTLKVRGHFPTHEAASKLHDNGSYTEFLTGPVSPFPAISRGTPLPADPSFPASNTAPIPARSPRSLPPPDLPAPSWRQS